MVTYHLTLKKIYISWSFYSPTFSLSVSCFSHALALPLSLSLSCSPSLALLSHSPSILLIFHTMADFNLAMQIAALYACDQPSSRLDQDIINQVNIILSACEVTWSHPDQSTQEPNGSSADFDHEVPDCLHHTTPEQETSYHHRPSGDQDKQSTRILGDKAESTKAEEVMYIAAYLNNLSL